jgi:peroxiredoxin
MLVSAPALFLAWLLLGGGPDLERGSQPTMQTSPASASISGAREPAEPPPTEICAGDPAPDFAFQGVDHRWMQLHHLLDQGPVLLVFGPTRAELTQLDLEKDDLLSLGVVPVAVLDRTAGVARRLATEQGLRYPVLADARQVIAVQFNCTDGGRMLRGWFVIDQHGKVRALRRGDLPEGDYPNLCARALGLATPGVPLPASR